MILTTRTNQMTGILKACAVSGVVSVPDIPYSLLLFDIIPINPSRRFLSQSTTTDGPGLDLIHFVNIMSPSDEAELLHQFVNGMLRHWTKYDSNQIFF